jgi:L-threonate 2-dehydrogenase
MNTRATKTATSQPTNTLPRVGFLGLGIMGTAMSNNLIKAGFQVCGFDPSAAARARLKKNGGEPCASMAALATSASVIITSLPSAAALMSAAQALCDAAPSQAGGAGTVAPAKGKKSVKDTGQVVIETSTLDVNDKEAARALLAAHGITLLDCPLSGTGAQAAVKDLSIYTSGPAKTVKQLKPVFDGFTKANYYLGAFGNGMKMKLMANLLVAIHNVSTAEVLLFGERLGIAPADAVKVLADGAGGSRMFNVRGPVMADKSWAEATMKVSVWQKDMKLIGDALVQTQSAAPLFAATVPIYNAAMGLGHAH